MQNRTIYRKDYQPYPFCIQSTELSIALYEHDTLVTNTMKIKRTAPGDLFLNGENLELLHVKMDGVLLSERDYQKKGDDLLIQTSKDTFTLEIMTRIYPHKNTTLNGLYRSGKLFCTQCEAEGFRAITYFPDRPDVMTTYTTTISAEANDYPILLSNGNCVASGISSDGRRWITWKDPFKKPSYLFALVAGDLAMVQDTFKTQSGRTIDLRIYVEKGNENKCAHAMRSLKQAMRWDEEKFGREYDLDTYMIVAVNDFNFGAMENKGLTIFDARFLLATPETGTDYDFFNIENVVGHEYFHNWTGNRITCRDWFQLSLKESLTLFRDQEFSSDMNTRDIVRLFNVRLLLNEQFPEDAGGMAHAIRPESYIEINNFYTTTVYNKGAEVIRMQQTLLGEQGFRRGMDLYFERHDGQAVTIDDFVRAMEDANHVDFTQLKLWYSQAGTPEVQVESHYENQCLTLKMRQSCAPSPECKNKQPFHIPIKTALFNPQGQLVKEMQIELKTREATFQFDNISEKPLVSLLRTFSAPIKLTFSQDLATRIQLLSFETDGYAKWNASQSIALDLLHHWFEADENDHLIPKAFIDALKTLLQDTSVNPGILAEILLPPTFEEATASLANVDVIHIETIRDAYRQRLGQALFPELEKTYIRLWKQEDNQMNAKAYGRRALRNATLSLMMKGDEKQARPYCLAQFNDAKTMSDKDESFRLLVNSTDKAIQTQAIAAFHQQWSHDEMVMDKWFAAQAQMDMPDILLQVKKLMQHPDFQVTNPNKMHALIESFCKENLRHFHAIDGSGYVFLREVLLDLDKINPQVSAQLATPLTAWKHFDPGSQRRMREQLEVMAKSPLSRDLSEVVMKSLAVE